MRKVFFVTGSSQGIGKATAIYFFASEDADYINGTVLKVDGGM